QLSVGNQKLIWPHRNCTPSLFLSFRTSSNGEGLPMLSRVKSSCLAAGAILLLSGAIGPAQVKAAQDGVQLAQNDRRDSNRGESRGSSGREMNANRSSNRVASSGRSSNR